MTPPSARHIGVTKFLRFAPFSGTSMGHFLPWAKRKGWIVVLFVFVFCMNLCYFPGDLPCALDLFRWSTWSEMFFTLRLGSGGTSAAQITNQTKVVVTGAGRVVGYQVVMEAVAKGATVIAVDDWNIICPSPFPTSKNIIIVDCSFKNLTCLEQVFQNYGPLTVVYHFQWMASLILDGKSSGSELRTPFSPARRSSSSGMSEMSEELPDSNYYSDTSENYGATLFLMSTAAKYGVRCFVLGSTTAVYGVAPDTTETTVPLPLSPGGVSSYALELHLSALHQSYPSTDYIIMRFHDLYGIYMNFGMVSSVSPVMHDSSLQLVMNQLMQRAYLAPVPAEVPVRELERAFQFTNAEDVAPMILQAPFLSHCRNEIFNMGVDYEYSWKDLHEVLHVFFRVNVTFVQAPPPRPPPSRFSGPPDRTSPGSVVVTLPNGEQVAVVVPGPPPPPPQPSSDDGEQRDGDQRDGGASIPTPLRVPYRAVSHRKQRKYFGKQPFESYHRLALMHRGVMPLYVWLKHPAHISCEYWIKRNARLVELAARKALAAAKKNNNGTSSPDFEDEEQMLKSLLNFRTSKKVAVLVETRFTNEFLPVVNNFMVNLLPDWKIQIFHSDEVKSGVLNSHLAFYVRIGKVILTPLSLYPTTKQDFSSLMVSKQFWNQVEGEKALIFQLDSILCSRSKWKVDDFLEWDYIGAPWGHYGTTTPGFLPPLGGNGGLSIRSKSLCLRVLSQHPWAGEPEDIYFSRFIDRVGGKVAPKDVAQRFSVEGIYYIGSAGIHQPWLAGPGLSAKRGTFPTEIEAYCPEWKMNARYGLV